MSIQRLSDLLYAAEGRTPRILLVDDEAAITVPMVRYFQQRGCTTKVAADPEAALALAAVGGYDLAIVDLRLTHSGSGEGLDVVSEIRRGGSDTVIVVLSAHIDELAEEEARGRGADAVLRKPQPLGELARVAFALMGTSGD